MSTVKPMFQQIILIVVALILFAIAVYFIMTYGSTLSRFVNDVLSGDRVMK